MGLDEFQAALKMLREHSIFECNEGSLVVLGFGLLLRECWRAVEAEEDDESTPEFLRESVLSMKRAHHIIKAIEEVTGRLPSLDVLDADEETPRKEVLDDTAKGKKAKAGQKKPAKRKQPIHTPSPVPSSSKRPADTGNDDSSPTKNIRSQRQRKPSKRLCGYD